MGKTYNLGKKELNNFLQECVIKCIKNKDNINSVVKNTLNEWGVTRVSDGKGGHKFILDDSDDNCNVYYDNEGNNLGDNLINIDTRTYIGKDKGTYDIENSKGYGKYILFSTLAELVKINPNIFTEGEFKQISISLRELLDKMVEVHSQQNLKQQTVNEKKINIQPLKRTSLNQNIVNKEPKNQNIVNKQPKKQNIVNKKPINNVIKHLILNITQCCLEGIDLVGQLKTNPRYQSIISNDFVKCSVNYINKSQFNGKNQNEISTDLSQLATIFAGETKDSKVIYYFIQQETKFMSTIFNHRKLNQEYIDNNIDEKERLSYYQAILPGTDVDIISLFSFSNFAGTEIIKANAISTASEPVEQMYGTNPTDPNKKRVSITWEGGDNLNPEDYFKEGNSDGHKFIQLILSHADNVLRKINYIPNFIICVPSSAKFNENIIKALAQRFGCTSYEAFMVKNWLEYQMSDEDKQKIEKSLLYRKYQYGKTEYNTTVNAFQDLVSRAVGNTFCRMICSYIEKNKDIMDIINNCPIQEGDLKRSVVQNYILKLVLQKMCENKNFHNFINNNSNINKHLNKNAVNYINQFNKKEIDKNIADIAEQAEIAFKDYLPQDGKNTVKPLQININSIEWKDTEVQMTSLIDSGHAIKKGSKLNGADARPLIVSVYIVNQQKYELTKDGQRLIQDLQAVPDIPGQLNESEKVEINNKRILIFDDDIDTGASMKLCVNSMENILKQYNIQSTELKGLTAFTNLGSPKIENTSN